MSGSVNARETDGSGCGRGGGGGREARGLLCVREDLINYPANLSTFFKTSKKNSLL